MIAVAYAFCVLAPAGALAVVNSPTVFHCIGDLNATATPAKQENTAHTHADGTAHQHAQSGALDQHPGQDGKADAGNCCGLFCVSALAHDPGLTFGVSAPASCSVTTLTDGLSGRAPGPLHRPPIA